ncbi:hypothetical protein ACWEJ6_51455 [Nonomuraea sp. NPDC004702]
MRRDLRADRAQFDAADLAGLIAALPSLAVTAQTMAEHTDDPAGWAPPSALYNLATDTLNKIGRKDTARLTADRAMIYAARSEDGTARAASARALGMMLRGQNRHDLAAQVMTQGLNHATTPATHTTGQASLRLRLL